MTFDDQTFAFLAQFEDNMRTAINSRWARHPGFNVMPRLAEIYNAATGQHRHVNASCQGCVLDFLTDLGRLYFEDKEERLDNVNPVQEEPKKKPAKKAKK